MMPIESYFKSIDNCIQYVENSNHPYTATQVINNYHDTMLDTDLYIETINNLHKKTSSDKSWENFRKFFDIDYHDLCELQHINETKAGFHSANMAIKIQDKIT